MNYSELKAAWRQWSHREDLDDSLLDTIQELTTARLGRDLRTLENEVNETITVDASGYVLTSNFMEMRSVKGYKDFEIAYLTPAQFSADFSSGRAQSYSIINGRLFVDGTGDVTIDWWTRPAQLTDTAQTNPVLTAWPNVYLYGGLTEIFRYLVDNEQSATYQGFYNDEIHQTNRQAQSARIGPAAQMRSVI